VVGAEVTVVILQLNVFDLAMNLHPWLWVLGPLGGSLLILVVGMFSTRSLISTPPIIVLRGLD
jgi:putative ABC transport system permease protein